MSGWYLDPVTGKKITLGPGETLAGTGLVGDDFTLIESGPGYLHTSWLDKAFSFLGKGASYAAGGGGGAVGLAPGVAPFEWMPKVSISRPPESLAPYMTDMVDLGPGPGSPEESVGGPGAESSGLMPWAIGAAVVVGLLFFVKFK